MKLRPRKEKLPLRNKIFRACVGSYAICSLWFGINPANAQARNQPMAPNCTKKVSAQVGNCAPDFNATSLRGKAVHLRQHHGEVVLLHFWATWCEACLVELPTLISLYKKLKSKPIRIITVSLDSEPAPLKKFFKGTMPPFPVVLDSVQQVSTRFGTFKVPETFILGANGLIRDKIIGGMDWDNGLILHYLECLAKNASCKK